MDLALLCCMCMHDLYIKGRKGVMREHRLLNMLWKRLSNASAIEGWKAPRDYIDGREALEGWVWQQTS